MIVSIGVLKGLIKGAMSSTFSHDIVIGL